MNVKDYIEILQWIFDEKEIEFFSNQSTWIKSGNIISEYKHTLELIKLGFNPDRFRLKKREPKILWVNEFKDETKQYFIAYPTKEKALEIKEYFPGSPISRYAVKYIEVIEDNK